MSSPLALLAMGNPLLDMQVVDKPELLEKYSLKPNDAVLAEGKQSEMCVRSSSSSLHVSDDSADREIYGADGRYDDLQKNYDVLYVAGGAAQNCARAAQVRSSCQLWRPSV
jgi:adenosine kinase